MSTGIRGISPDLAGRLEALAQEPAFEALSRSLWVFSLIETFHLLFMAILGGSVLLLNLRLLGVTMPDVPPRDIERATRPWFWVGAAGTIGTGLVMALATVMTVLSSAAFVIKLIALVAAILFSLAVSAFVRKDAAETGRWPLVSAAIAVLLWALSLGLFAFTRNLGTGALLVAITGFALFAALTPQRRLAYLAGVTAILATGITASLLSPASEEGDALARTLSVGAVALAFGFALTVLFFERRGVWQAFQPTQLIAFASTLAWITTAAAGRWIGFS